MECTFCNGDHTDAQCPKVSSLEYYPDGELKKVEFHRPYYHGGYINWPSTSGGYGAISS